MLHIYLAHKPYKIQDIKSLIVSTKRNILHFKCNIHNFLYGIYKHCISDLRLSHNPCPIITAMGHSWYQGALALNACGYPAGALTKQ